MSGRLRPIGRDYSNRRSATYGSNIQEKTKQTINTMKKQIIAIAILLGFAIGATAQKTGGGLFMRGESYETGNGRGSDALMLPIHGNDGDQDAQSPLGSGVAVLLGLGTAYAIGKRRKDD